MGTAALTADLHARLQLKGEFEVWMSRPKRPLQTVVATAATVAERRAIAAYEMHEILRAVHERSVEGVARAGFAGDVERRRRFGQLEQALAERGLISI